MIPNAIATGNVRTNLAEPLLYTSTTITVQDGSEFPPSDFQVRINRELIHVGTRDGNIFSDLTRRDEGTGPRAIDLLGRREVVLVAGGLAIEDEGGGGSSESLLIDSPTSVEPTTAKLLIIRQEIGNASLAMQFGDNILLLEAVAVGHAGDAITLAVIDPGASNPTLTVSVDGSAITVTPVTDDEDVITSLLSEIAAAITASPEASALVTASVPDADGPAALADPAVLSGGAQDLLVAPGVGGLVIAPISNPDYDSVALLIKPPAEADDFAALIVRTGEDKLTLGRGGEIHSTAFLSLQQTGDNAGDVILTAVTSDTERTVDLAQIYVADGGAMLWGVNKQGLEYKQNNSFPGPADEDVAASQVLEWYDDTPGAIAARFKAMDSDATLYVGHLVALLEDGTIKLPNLPTSDPGVADQLWNSSGTLKVSAG